MPRPPPTSRCLDQVEQAVQGVEVRLDLGDLRADMAVDADHFDARQRRRLLVGGECLAMGDAELVALQAGRDVRMGAGVDIRVDAQADRRAATGLDGDGRQRQQLALAFDVEALHANLQGAPSRRLPTPENTTLAASPPAASTRSSSPTETMSNPQPAWAKVCSTARFELALIA